jgi:uncharacterized protein (TIGR03437 family)
VFLGWPAPGGGQAFETAFVVRSPLSLHPRFEPAVRMRLETSPEGLGVLADRAPVVTPVVLDWAVGSQHTLGPVSPQHDIQGRLWVFERWEHGGEAHQSYTVRGTANVAGTVRAIYQPGARVSLLTAPAGLKLEVDGRDSWPGYDFAWAMGSTHRIAAPAEQVDGRGRRHVWVGWSNGGGAAQEVMVREADVRLIASYETLGKLTVSSEPEGVALVVEGAECRAPCTVERRAGGEARLAAPAAVAWSGETRLEFAGWSDGGPRERVWTAGTEEARLVARYRASHRLEAGVEPAEGAGIRLEPASEDGFYAEGAEVRVTAEARPGYRFRYWQGDLEGRWATGVVRMGGPRRVRAVLEEVPEAAEAGVQNAAGETPEAGVAPGSLIVIYGAKLAGGFEAAVGSPLPQTLGEVTVQVGGRLLPLVYVSPEQVSAQLPAELEEGLQRVVVRWEGRGETAVDFQVVRNAPGLFTREVEGARMALAAGEDGGFLGAEQAARRGETITLYGTGFGPSERRLPDGFAVEEPAPRLADRVEILAGEQVLEPVSATAAAGHVGLVALRLRIPEDAPARLELKVRVNGHESNTVAITVLQ